MDFVGATPDMIQYKLSDAEPPIGTIAETGLKRRLMKGGAAADFAVADQLQRAKANIRDKGYKINRYNSRILPLSSKGAKWGPGEGKFQVIQDYDTSAFDLNKATGGGIYGMGEDGASRIIAGHPHELGMQFSHTLGLDEGYRGKGYGKAIYQNLADVYGGGISDSRSTTDAARQVYRSLDAIDTGIPSGYETRDISTTRQALPTTAMKNDPAAMAAFEAKVKEYALPRTGKTALPRIEVEDTDLPGNQRYLARKPNTEYAEYGKTPDKAIEALRETLPNMSENPRRRWPYSGTVKFFDDVDGPAINDALLEFNNYKYKSVPEDIVAALINSVTGKDVTADTLPNMLDFAGYRWRRPAHSNVFELEE
jgi:GNAT superfamily N-acetyltransferase